MSHHSTECAEKHNWGTWSTEQIQTAAGDQMYVLQRFCYDCGKVDQEPMAIRELRE